MHIKNQLILSYHRDGKSIRSISLELGIHRLTVTSYVRNYESLGNSQNSSGEKKPYVDALTRDLIKTPSYDSSNRTMQKLTDEVKQ